MTRSTRRSCLTVLGALVAAGFVSCGGNSQTPTTPTTTVPTTPTTTQPPVSQLNCVPTPAPLYRVELKTHGGGGGYRQVLDSRPLVQNVDNYCERAGVPGRYFCPARNEGDPMAPDCDAMAVGRAADTHRWGPTWYYEGRPCAEGENPGCANHPDNQFLVVAKGAGEFMACAAPEIKLSDDPDRPGERCTFCRIDANGKASCSG